MKNGKYHFTISDPEQLTRSTELPEESGKGDVQDDPDPDPSLSDSSAKKKKHDRKKKRHKPGNMTRQTHHGATIPICRTIVIMDAIKVRGETTRKRIQ